MSATSDIGPTLHPDGFAKAGGSGGPGAVGGQFNVKEATQVISNSSTCTLKFESSGASFMKSKNTKNNSTYTVQFNKETTKTTKTTSAEVRYDFEIVAIVKWYTFVFRHLSTFESNHAIAMTTNLNVLFFPLRSFTHFTMIINSLCEERSAFVFDFHSVQSSCGINLKIRCFWII